MQVRDKKAAAGLRVEGGGGDTRRGARHCTPVAGLAAAGVNTAMSGRTVYQVSQNEHAKPDIFSHPVYPLSQNRRVKHLHSAALSTNTAKTSMPSSRVQPHLSQPSQIGLLSSRIQGRGGPLHQTVHAEQPNSVS